MGKTENPLFGKTLGQLRGKAPAPKRSGKAASQDDPVPERTLTFKQARHKFNALSPADSEAAWLGPTLPERSFSAGDINGHTYWYDGGLVFAAPEYLDGSLDLDNSCLAGETDGAELDLYGLECQIAAALCRRVGDQNSAEIYAALSRGYFQEAERDGVLNWPDRNDRPKIPEVI